MNSDLQLGLLRRTQEQLSHSQSEQRRMADALLVVLDALPAHIAMLDPDGVITSVNASWRQFASENGLQSPDFGVGQSYPGLCDTVVIRDAAEADDAQQVAMGIRSVLSGEAREVSIEYPCHSPTEERWFRMSVTALQADEQQVTGAVVMHVDISERKRAELTALFDDTDAMVLILNPLGRSETVNQAFSQATGWTAQQAVMHSVTEWPVALSSVAKQQLRAPQRRHDGSQFMAAWSITPILGRGGQLLSHVCIGRDITRELQADALLRENDKLRAVATLAGGIAHDFNNLLGSITGLTELCLLEAPKGSRQAGNLDRIGQASGKAAALVRQMLDFSRQQPLELRPLLVSSMFKHAEGMLRAGLPAGVELELTTSEDGLASIDLVQMEQVLLNLCRNAAHAMRAHGGLIRLRADRSRPTGSAVPSLPEPGFARLQIIDSGEGIASADLPRIFEPFFTTKPVGEGTGLGLAASHGIVHRHGGLIEVSTAPQVGTTFSIFLPLLQHQQALANHFSPPQAGFGLSRKAIQ